VAVDRKNGEGGKGFKRNRNRKRHIPERIPQLGDLERTMADWREGNRSRIGSQTVAVTDEKDKKEESIQ